MGNKEVTLALAEMNGFKSLYFKELLVYLCWYKRISKERGNDNPLSWDSGNWAEYQKRDGELSGMERLLGLSESEKKAMEDEAKRLLGFPKSGPLG